MAIVEYDYSIENPINIIGDFDTGRSVNIELWVDNVLQTVTSSGCEEVDSTGAYIGLRQIYQLYLVLDCNITLE